MEFASAMLNDIAGLYNAADVAALARKRGDLVAKFSQVEAALGGGPFFGGTEFTLVDAAFAPVFRYFDTFHTILDLGVLRERPRSLAWRGALAARPSVVAAMERVYSARLRNFLLNRNAYLSQLIAETGTGGR